MVKKLFKHEALAYLRVWIPMQIIVLSFSVFLAVLGLFPSDLRIYQIVYGSSIFAFVVSAIVSLVLTTIFAVTRFYKNLFTSEGYLSFTLPVTADQHLLVKLLTASAFTVGSMLVVVASVFLAFGKYLGKFLTVDLPKVFDVLTTLSGVHFGIYVTELALTGILSLFSSFLLFYFCIALGQTFRKNRVFGAIAVYFVHQFVFQILSTAASIFAVVTAGIIPWSRIGEMISGHPLATIHIGLIGSMLLEAGLCAVYYFVTRYVMRRKLNLE